MNNDLIPCESCNALIPIETYYTHLFTCQTINASFFERQPFEASEVNNGITGEEQKRSKRDIDKTIPSIPVLEKTECFICLEQIKNNIKELPCGHKTCVNCSHIWFQKSSECPYCKKKIF